MTPQDVRELFRRGRQAKRELDLLRAHRARLLDGVRGGGIPTMQSGGEVSDPTGQAANVLVDMSAEWASDEAHLLGEIDECRALCAGVGMACGCEYRVVLEDRYLLEMEWKEIAMCIDRSLRTVYTMARTAYEYVAFVGLAAAKAGLGRAAE